MTYFVIVLFFYRVYVSFASHVMKIAALCMLMVFYVLSCSFCTPVLKMAEAAAQESTVAEETQTVAKTASGSVSVSLDGAQAQDAQLLQAETGTQENQDAALADKTDNYSIDEILQNSSYQDSKAQAQDTVSGNDVQEQAADHGDFHKDDWNLILINKAHPIPDQYQFNLGTITGNLQCDERIIPDLLEMLKQAKKDGIDLTICSPYRNLTHQQQLFDKKINYYMKKQGMSYMDAYKTASQAVTVPGASEHQVGLALDIYTPSYRKLDAGFGETQAGKWLEENSCRYGFILRYPEGKEYITGIEYEPWHFRYVGKAAAQDITEKGITLEEFINSL